MAAARRKSARALGDPARLAREMRAEVGFRRWESDRSAGNLAGVILALLGLATLDLMFLLPILIVMVAVFFGLACGCIGMRHRRQLPDVQPDPGRLAPGGGQQHACNSSSPSAFCPAASAAARS